MSAYGKWADLQTDEDRIRQESELHEKKLYYIREIQRMRREVLLTKVRILWEISVKNRGKIGKI
jgi:hypothetical protein